RQSKQSLFELATDVRMNRRCYRHRRLCNHKVISMAIIYQDDQPGKICTKCEYWRPVERFPKRLLSRDGYSSICNECCNATSREWRAKNKDRVQELNREYYEANREERKAYHRRYRRENPEYFREKMQAFRDQNRTYQR